MRIVSRTDHELVLAWLPAQAAPGHTVVRYEIFLNGTKVGETADLSVSSRYESAERLVEFFSVRAVDEQGNRSAPSNEAMAPRPDGPRGIFVQAKRAFGQRDIVGFQGFLDGGTTFLRRTSTYQRRGTDPDTGNRFAWDELIVQTYDLDSGRVFNRSQVAITGSGIPGGDVSIDWEGYEDASDFGGVRLEVSLVTPLSDDAHIFNDHAWSETNGPSDYYERSEVVYALPVFPEDLQSGVEADFLQAQAQLEFLDWDRSYGVSRTQPVEARDVPFAYRDMNEISASDYRIGVPAGGPWHVRWAEIFTPAGGGGNEVLKVNDELLDATNGPAFTSIHRAEPPDRFGQTTIVLLTGISEAVPAASEGPRTFVPNAIFAGQEAHLLMPQTTFVPGGGAPSGPVGPAAGVGALSPVLPFRFTSIVMTANDPANAVKFFAVDPAMEISDGLAEAIAEGREVSSGTNLASLQLPNGMGYGQWQLIAIGQGAGSVEIALEYERSPASRLTTTLTVYPAIELAVDFNRDHSVTMPGEGSSDRTTADTPFRFWLNDDFDRGHSVDDTDYEQDDIGPAEASANGWMEDWNYNYVPSERDLEDFARLSVATRGWEQSLKTGEVLLGLKWVEASGNPAIKLYRQSEPGGGTGYLTDALQASLQRMQPAVLDDRESGGDLLSVQARTVVGLSEVFVLPKGVWAEDGARRSFLFEGCRPGTGCVRPVLLRRDDGDYVEIGEMPGVWFDLKRMGQMYEHWSVGNGNGAAPAEVAERIAAETTGDKTFTYTVEDSEERKYILYVHGWNMEKWEKERFAETAYKRLYWQGYRGRFGLFSWPTTYGFESEWDAIWDSTNFDRGEFSAWRSGAPLRQLLQDLAATYDGELYVFSHSMGAVVASEAFRLQSDARGPQIAKVYVAGQAALSAHVYDGSLPDGEGAPDALQWHYTHPRLHVLGAYGPDTPDVYRNWAAFIASGSAVSSAVVGRVINFYNENDFALSAPVWQFDQLTKPDFADFPDSPWEYRYDGDPAPAPTSTGFRKFGKFTNLAGERTLQLGTRTAPADRYEIMAFAAESRVKALGATANPKFGISGAVNLRTLWPADDDGHKAHRWHSAEFRSVIQHQVNWWKVLLGKPGFDISTDSLP